MKSPIPDSRAAQPIFDLILVDGRRFRGPPLAIVQAMLERAPFCEDRSIAGYAAFLAANTRKMSRVMIRPAGADDESLAASLVSEMLRVGLATQSS